MVEIFLTGSAAGTVDHTKDLFKVQIVPCDVIDLKPLPVHGLGVSILSSLIMRDIHEQVQAVPLEPPAVRRLCLAMSERRQSDRNIRRFLRCAQTVVGRMEKPL